jgi:hypothetical protein
MASAEESILIDTNTAQIHSIDELLARTGHPMRIKWVLSVLRKTKLRGSLRGTRDYSEKYCPKLPWKGRIAEQLVEWVGDGGASCQGKSQG